MKFNTRITNLFQIKFPIIQGGMIWASGAKLASAVSNTGGLGLIGSGSMRPDVLLEHIKKAKALTNKPFGVNLPLIYKYTEEHIKIILQENIKIVFTSAGSPLKYTKIFKDNGIIITHVVSNSTQAKKCEDAGCDAVVCEGTEAGGHNGREELTTMVLTPQVVRAVKIPVIAAGGIATGEQMLACFSLGAEGVQVGTRFAISEESSLHDNFKSLLSEAREDSTILCMRKVSPVRAYKNKFINTILEMEDKGATREELIKYLGEGRSKIGMFEGALDEGELEIGQVASMCKDLQPTSQIIQQFITEYEHAKNRLP